MHWLKTRHVYKLQRLSHSGRLCRAIILFRKTLGTGSIKMLRLDKGKKKSVISKHFLVSLLGKEYLQLIVTFDQKFFSTGRALRERMLDRHFIKGQLSLHHRIGILHPECVIATFSFTLLRVHWLTWRWILPRKQMLWETGSIWYASFFPALPQAWLQSSLLVPPLEPGVHSSRCLPASS